MGNINHLDLRIVDFIKKILNYYIKKRLKYEEKKEDKLWQKKFAKNNAFIHGLGDDLFIKLFKDSIISRLIYLGFEQTEISFLKKYLRKGDVFFDIGANIGLFTLTASKIVKDEGRIYAFEPTPSTYSRLVSNIELNKINNVEANRIGLSNSNSFVDFNISNDGYDAWNSLVKLKSVQNCDIIKISVETLDSYVERNKIKKVNLVKLDVEGWEKYVLEGSRNLLSQENAPVFIIEFTEENAFSAGYYCGEVYDLMKSYGYDWYSYDPLTEVLRKESKKLHYPYENLIAVKNISECIQRIKSYSLNNI